MTQPQFGVHCLKANPIAFFADSSIHRSTVDDRPVISSFPVGYSDVNLTDRILRDKFFDPPGTPTHPCGHPGRQWYLDECCEHIRPSQEAVGSVYSLPDLIIVVLDGPRYVPLAIHNIAQVGVPVGGIEFLVLQGHTSSQIPAYRHYPALGSIHSHFTSVRPFSYGIQCGL
ncbi:hypothetical protein AYI70_g9628 [Smittium culicis]|uniref:Uncharacterized protein n=1 Tax=Smittium culicis TaxID=133412 RepID=A0A1R1XAC6_9FUNG|nr:hypothetical protein AYI70_g9628 [Smittium culicis]